MSEILAKMCDSTARQLEERAAKATDPTKRDKLLAKAAKQRQEAEAYRRVKGSSPAPPQAPRTGPMQGAGPPHPGQRPGPGMPPAGMHPMDAPTHQLRHVPPRAGQPTGQAPPPPPRQGLPPVQGGAPAPGPEQPGKPPMSRAKKIGVGVVAVFAVIGFLGMLGGRDAAEEGFDAATGAPASSVQAAPAAAPTSGADPADMQACLRAGEVMEAWGPVATGLSTGDTSLSDLARETRTASDGMSEVPIMANDPAVTAASRALTGQYEMIAAAAARGDLSTLTSLASEGPGMIDDLVAACQAAAA